jgi:hypothetical protein
MYRPRACIGHTQPNFQIEIIERIIFSEYYFRSRNYEYNFFKMKCEVISNISRAPFFPLNFRQKMCGLYMRKYGIYCRLFYTTVLGVIVVSTPTFHMVDQGSISTPTFHMVDQGSIACRRDFFPSLPLL